MRNSAEVANFESGLDEPGGRTSRDELLAEHVVVRRLERGSAEVIFLATAADPNDVVTVVKIQRIPPAVGSDARALYSLHQHLATAADAAGVRPVAPRPLGWGADPDLFAYEYAVGIPVKERLESLALERPSWPDECSDIARDCGAVLARFHSAIGAHRERPVLAGRLDRACRRLSGGAVSPRGGAVRSLCDSGPHNLIMGADGDIRLIDLPTDERWTSAEFDVGVLAHRLARRAAIAFRSSASTADAHRVFTDPLCDSYADASGPALDRADVMASFASSSFVFAKRSLTVGHPHASLGYARRDLRWGLATLALARGRPSS